MYKPDLTRAYLFYVPPHHEQFYRPYEAVFEGDTMRKIEIYTERGNHLSPAAIADISSSVVRPSSAPQGMVQLPYGYSDARMAFFIEISKKSVYGSSSREIISGFTSHVGVDHYGNIDPQMVFYINSRMEIRDIVQTTPVGTNVVPGNIWQDTQVLARTATPCVSLRPEDVIGTAQINLLMDGANVVDTRSNLGMHTAASDRYNAVPSHYLSKVLDSYMQAHAMDRVNDGNEKFYENALVAGKTESYQLSNFLGDMGMVDPTRNHFFTFAEINSTYPRPANFWAKSMPRPGQQIMSPVNYAEHWGGGNIEAAIAYSITHAMPALMSRLMLKQVVLEINNQNPAGMPVIGFAKQVGLFDGVITPQKMEYLHNQIMIDIVRGIVLSRVATFLIKMDIDILGSGKFEISVNGNPAIPYVAPMWCESYSSPVIGQGDNLNALASNMEMIHTQLAVLKYPNNDFDTGQDMHSFAKTQQQLFGNMVQQSVQKAPVRPMNIVPAPRSI